MLLAKNRKAKFKYEILDTYLAGIVLNGYEVKAIREKKVSFEGSYVKFVENKPYVAGLHIGRYSKQSQDAENIDTKRERALLLNKNEIIKLRTEINQKGKTVVPMALVLRNNMIKLELAVVKGRKKHEKKVVAKEKQLNKELDIATKNLRKTEGMPRL